MRSTPFLFLAAAAIVRGFVVPDGPVDGVYTVALDRRGEPIGEAVKVRDLNIKRGGTRNGKNGIEKRDDFPGKVDTGCEDGALTDTDNTAALKSAVDYCNGGGRIEGSNVMFWPSGESVYYICDFNSDGEYGCNEKEMQDANARLGETCPLQAGWVFVNDWNRSYGRAKRKHKICTNLWRDTYYPDIEG